MRIFPSVEIVHSGEYEYYFLLPGFHKFQIRATSRPRRWPWPCPCLLCLNPKPSGSNSTLVTQRVARPNLTHFWFHGTSAHANAPLLHSVWVTFPNEPSFDIRASTVQKSSCRSTKLICVPWAPTLASSHGIVPVKVLISKINPSLIPRQPHRRLPVCPQRC